MSEQVDKEIVFHPINIKVRFEIPAGEHSSAAALMRSLCPADGAPTLHLLDVCAISHIKTHLKKPPAPSVPVRESISELIKLDKPRDGISYIAAFLEIISDLKKPRADEDLIAEVSGDIVAMQKFFTKARVYEKNLITPAMILELKGEHPEELGPAYLEFLIYVNSMGLHDKPLAERRLELVADICSKAQSLGILKNHPVVIVSVACVYSFLPAFKVVKFKKNPDEFDASNALGDIQLVQRIANFSNMILNVWIAHGKGYAKTKFFTDDRNLRLLLDCFTVTNVTRKEIESQTTTNYQMTTDFARLLPVLHTEAGHIKGLEEEDERYEVYRLLGIASS
ncbi:hypothetical protein [Pseudomonas sp. MWU12-2345]|uniref:hypothetical protein n=1 Tax=Pseudomonas sp. MWU12-2345 TaxID=2928689 RepID=UPI0020105ED6|nr:hypothetical protein [Pseudomonas sp. MWU12-2345]